MIQLRTSLITAAIIGVGGTAIYQKQLAPVEVELHRVQTSDVQAFAQGTGTLEPLVRVAVSTIVQGRVIGLFADQNDRVTSGQLLARLDDEELLKQVEIAESELEAKRAAVARAQAELGKAGAVHANAKRSHDRNAMLLKSRTISQSEFDETAEALRVADAEVKRSAAATTEAERQVTAAMQRVDYQRARMRESAIDAPFDALVVRRNKEIGNIAVPGASIFDLVSLSELRVAAWIDETAIAGIRTGSDAQVSFHSEMERTYAANVVRVGSEVDRETREFVVEIQPKELPARWAIGQRADVRVATFLKRDVPVLPLRLVRWKGGKPDVMAVKDGRSVTRPIVLGISDGKVAEVKHGVAPGDEVIDSSSDGKPRKIREGRRVAQR